VSFTHTFEPRPTCSDGVHSETLDALDSDIVVEKVPTSPGEASKNLHNVAYGVHAGPSDESCAGRMSAKSTVRTVGQYKKDGAYMVKSGHSFRIPRSAWGVAAIMPITCEVHGCRDWFRVCFLSYSCLMLSACTQMSFVYGIRSITLRGQDVSCDELAMDASLVILCLVIYLMSVLNDMEETLDLAELYFDMIPTVPGHSQVLYFDEDSNIVCGGFSRCRKKLLALCLLAPKFIIAVFLGYNGTLYLASSANDSELLLNTLALEFVLGVDEMIYHSIAPMSTRSIMLQIPAFRTQERRAFFRWADAISPIIKIGFCIWLARYSMFLVNPQTADCVGLWWAASDGA